MRVAGERENSSCGVIVGVVYVVGVEDASVSVGMVVESGVVVEDGLPSHVGMRTNSALWLISSTGDLPLSLSPMRAPSDFLSIIFLLMGEEIRGERGGELLGDRGEVKGEVVGEHPLRGDVDEDEDEVKAVNCENGGRLGRLGELCCARPFFSFSELCRLGRVVTVVVPAPENDGGIMEL